MITYKSVTSGNSGDVVLIWHSRSSAAPLNAEINSVLAESESGRDSMSYKRLSNIRQRGGRPVDNLLFDIYSAEIDGKDFFSRHTAMSRQNKKMASMIYLYLK